jgi:hypothetical protein
MVDPKRGLERMMACFEALAIPYFIGGSMASSLHGLWRQTNDVDFVADIALPQVESLAQTLQEDFYADAAMMRSAISRGRPFNVIHLPTAFKFDVFPFLRDAFQQSEMRRRVRLSGAAIGIDGVIPTATVEDIVLAKLAWYRQGNSEQQWKDLQGIVQTKGKTLDREYLRQWARHLQVEDLLDALLS